MRTIISASFGLALAVSAFSLSSVPASAVETPAAAAAISSHVTKVEERHERCHHWREECHERYPGGGWRFRRCLTIHGCVG